MVTTIAKTTFHYQEVIGPAVPIAVKTPQVVPQPRQQLHRQLDNVMVCLLRIGAAVQPLTNAIKGVVIVIWTHIVLEV